MDFLRGVLGWALRGSRFLVAAFLRRQRFRDLIFFAAHVVHIEPFRVFGNLAVIGLVLVDVLDQVIPASPFPNDLACLFACGLNLYQAIGLEVRTLHALGSSARSDGFLFFNPFPTNGQNVPVGEFDGVMMRQTLCAVILELPNEIPVPIEFLKPAARGRALEPPFAIDDLGGAE